MDDAMLDTTMDESDLAGRLGAYAEARLTPDLTTSARLRARVLAGAHRQAALTRADAALAIVPRDARIDPRAARPGRSVRRGPVRWRTVSALALASALGIGLVGTVTAAPGGALYPARLWTETLTLPGDPSARAVAQLERMHQRLQEAAAAAQDGDIGAATAAIAAYASILDETSADALVAGDAVATAALEAGMRRDIAVLQALDGTLPSTVARGRIADAIDRAIARSDELGQIIDGARSGGASGASGGASSPGGGDGPGGNGPGGNGPGGNDPSGKGNGGNGPRPTAGVTPAPDDHPGNAHGQATPGPVAEPTKTAKPDPTPKTDDRSAPPPGGDQGGGQDD